MTKVTRLLILFLVLAVLILASLWENNSYACFSGQCLDGQVAGKLVPASNSRLAPQPVVQEKSVGQKGLIFVEFFAGY